MMVFWLVVLCIVGLNIKEWAIYSFSHFPFLSVGLSSLCLILLGWYLIRKIFCRPDKWLNDNGHFVLKNGEFEHHYLASQMLNRPLERNEVVHHINGRRADNRISNLCVMDWEEHEIFHAWPSWKKKKSGRYPSKEMQRRRLEERHGGIIL